MIVWLLSLLSLLFHPSLCSDCSLADTDSLCSDFVATNEPVVREEDSCTPPSNRNVTQLFCGNDGISQDDCYKAGCCYRNGECYQPLVEQRVDFRYYDQKMKYMEAYRTCRDIGYRLPCISNEFEYSRVRSRACGNVWLAGVPRDYVEKSVPFYDSVSEECSDQIGVDCRMVEDKQSLSLELAANNSYFLSLIPKSNRRTFLCIKEEWKTHLKVYPYHISPDNRYQWLLCGLTFSGDALQSKLSRKWTFYPASGGEPEVLVQENVRQQIRSGYYPNAIEATQPGKYVCSFNYLNKDGEETERSGWAYHYTELSCNLTVDGVSYHEEVVELKKQYNQDVVINLSCLGYPLPSIFWTLDINGVGPMDQPAVAAGQNLTIRSFASQIPLHQDATYTLLLLPKSDITTLPYRTVTLTKLPVPARCHVLLRATISHVQQEETFEVTGERQVRELDIGDEFSVRFECSGYPAPNMTVLKTVSQGNETSDEFLEVTDLIGQLSGSFGEEVEAGEDYRITLTLVLPSTPLTFTLELVRKHVAPSCSFNFTNVETGDTVDSVDGITTSHEIRTSSFAGQDFEITMTCDGFPVSEITAVKTELGAELSDPQLLDTSSGSISVPVYNFAGKSPVTQSYTLSLTLLAHSGNHTPVEVNVTIDKSIIMFDVEVPVDGITIKRNEQEQDEGRLEPVVSDEISHDDGHEVSHEVELPCRGATAPSLPAPSAYWTYNDKDLNLAQFGGFVRFKYPDKSGTDATVLLSTLSSMVAGRWQCVVLIDNKFAKDYTVPVEVHLPPVAPGQTLVTEILDPVTVRAASKLQPSYEYLGHVSYTGYMYSGQELLQTVTNTTVSGGRVHADFHVPQGSGKIQIGFKAGNQYGDSELSVLSDELDIFENTPSKSVAWIRRTNDSISDKSRTLSLKFSAVPDVDSYEVKLLTSEGVEIQTFKDQRDNSIAIEELKPETKYIVQVKGVTMVAGMRIYGPNSLPVQFTTAPAVLPAPGNLSGQPLESAGDTSAVLLTWSAPTSGAEFIDSYQLTYFRPIEEGEGEEVSRRKRQALQTYGPVHIPAAAKNKVIEDLVPGANYEFVLQSYSSDFGQSEPAKVTVQTLTAGPCPYTTQQLYPPRHCPPRVSLDRKFIYVKFYFDCYEETGLSFTGKHTSTHLGECAPWTEEQLKPFQSYNMPEVGTNYCRNFEGATKDGVTLHDKPWCYLADGSNETCSLRPCHSAVNEDCYEDLGYEYRGTQYSEECVEWNTETLEKHQIINYPNEILGSAACRNWEGSNMTRPWCFLIDGSKAECPVPPCGRGIVSLDLEDSSTSYIVSPRNDYVCRPLEGSQSAVLGVRHSFGLEGCESEQIFPEVEIPPEIGVTGRLWFKFLLTELLLTILVIGLWVCLLCRKRAITRSQKAVSMSGNSKKGLVSGNKRITQKSEQQTLESHGD